MAKASFVYSERLCGQCDPSTLEPLEEGQENPFGSSFPEHENSRMEFLVDGKETFAEMAEAIEGAKIDVRSFFWRALRCNDCVEDLHVLLVNVLRYSRQKNAPSDGR